MPMMYGYALSEWIVLNIEEHVNNSNKRLLLIWVLCFCVGLVFGDKYLTRGCSRFFVNLTCLDAL